MWSGIALGVLAATIVMGSFNVQPQTAYEPTPADEESKAPTSTASVATHDEKPDADSVLKKNYSDKAEDGFVFIDGYLYEVDSLGYVKTDFSDGMLYFGADGRFTSGDAELDKLVAALIASKTAQTDSRMDRLKTLYDYIRDNMEYVGYVDNNYSYTEPNGMDGWGNSVAREALSELAGNCYYYNSAFAALARGLGYQAYIVTGTCGLPSRTHCWCEIEYENMVYYCDPELEWSRSVYQQETADIFFKDWSQTEGWCYTPNAERQSEAKEAEAQAKYDAMIEYAKAHPSPRPTIAPTPTPAATPTPVQPVPAATPLPTPEHTATLPTEPAQQPVEQPTISDTTPEANLAPTQHETPNDAQNTQGQSMQQGDQSA